jgi:hypothetical protein
MADPITPAPTATQAPAPGAATQTPDPAPGAPAAAPSVEAAVQAALDRAAKADAAAYRTGQEAKTYADKVAQLEAKIKRIEGDPFEWMQKDRGITPEMALEHFAGGKAGPSEEVLQLRQELAEMKTWRAQLTQAQQEQQRQATIGGIAGQARQLVQAAQDPDVNKALAFADALSGGQADFAAKVAAYQKAAEASGAQLTASEAAGMLRSELAGMAKSMRENQALIKAWDDLLGRTPSNAQQATPAGTPAAPGQTLTSDMAQGGSGGAPPDFSKMTQAQQDEYFRKKYRLG